jgi:hypothetical protein
MNDGKQNKKRDRTTAGIDLKSNGQVKTGPAVAKKQRASDDLIKPFVPTFQMQDVSTLGTAMPPKIKTGRKFERAIERLRDGGSRQVSTDFNLKVRFGVRAETDLTVKGEFSVQQQSTGLVQGNLKTPNYSAYKGKTEKKSVLPVDLSQQRARLEGRAIKQLANSGPSFDATAKTLQFDELDLNRGGNIPKKTTLGGIALGSHLEDITAKRAVGLDSIGSAIRAKTMTAKWRMKLDGNADAGQGFRDDLLSAFPQLGTEKISAAGLPNTGISALKTHWNSGGNIFSAQKQVENIRDAHTEAYKAADDVFLSKFRTLESGNAASGTWWTENTQRFESILDGKSSGESNRAKVAKQEFDEIREEYRARKLTRHGIKYP